MSIAPALLALLCQAPGVQQELPASAFRAARNLPADRTLMYVECANLEVLDRYAPKITQLDALTDEATGAYLRFLMLDEELGRMFSWRPDRSNARRSLARRHADLAKILAAFDLGFGAALLFDDGERPRPRGTTFFASGRRGGDQLAARDLLRKVLEGKDGPTNGPEAGPRGFEVELQDSILAGSPVRMTLAEAKPGDDEAQMRGFHRRPLLAYAFGPGAAGVFVETAYDDSGRARAEKQLGRMLGMTREEKRGVLLAPLEDLAEGEERLMAGGLRFGPSVRLPGSVRDKDKEEMAQAGLKAFEGVQGELIGTSDGVREVYKLLDRTGEGGLFPMFQPPTSRQAEVAVFAPKDTILFLQVGFEGGLVEAWFKNLAGMIPQRWLEPMRQALLDFVGLPKAGDKGFAPLDELTLLVLPPSPGSPIPEPMMLLRRPRTEGEVEALLTTYAKMFLEGFGLDAKPEFRTLGKGDREITYVSLKDLMQTAGQRGFNEESMAVRAFGGGFFSVKRCGEHLIVGCNPRTVRAAYDRARAGAEGESLLVNEGYAKAFPASGEQDRVLSLYIDPKPYFEKDVITQTFFASIYAFTKMFESGGQVEVPTLPRPSEMARMFRAEHWSVHRKPYGLRFDHAGGTLSSPLVWTGMVFANDLFDTLAQLCP